MPESAELSPESKQRQAAIETFLGSLVKGAKTVSLYREGHSMILQIAQRVHQLLLAAIGQEPNLPLEIKAKEVLFNENPLTPSEETVAFASALHMLGIGQAVFSSRVAVGGLYEFMKLLVAKPEAGKTLTDLQKAVQGVRIDGLQIIFILSFVVTGEEDDEKQKPGHLSEKQIRAFTQATTLPDFLYLLLKQNEALTSKEAAALSDLLDSALSRETSIEQLESDMPWACYDTRIRERFDRFMRDLQEQKRWDRTSLVNQLSTIRRSDLVKLEERKSLEAREALTHSLDKARSVLKNPVGERQPKFAVLSYARLLSDLGQGGKVDALLGEHAFLKSLSSEGRLGEHLGELAKLVEENVASPGVASALAAQLGAAEPESEPFRQAVEFAQWLGIKMIPLLLEELRRVSDKAARRSLSCLLVALCRSFGKGPLINALADEDYFQVVQVLWILSELGLPETVKQVSPLLRHPHPKAREAVIRAMGRLGGTAAVNSLISFAKADVEPAEARLAVTTVSLLNEAGAAEKLMEAYPALRYEIQVGIVTALGRMGSPKTRDFVGPLAKRSFIEWLTGRNKELRAAAKSSLEQILKEQQGHGQAR
ncbi:MAG: HEAT repeat domain-containing protein [Elusimicrobia bacterium]|nr:HEAT repeat domain-containing protein [Elusimicrobiota bacterium]